VKAIKIRGQLHSIKYRTMQGYKTTCGNVASFGHTVCEVDRAVLDCPICRGSREKNSTAGII